MRLRLTLIAVLCAALAGCGGWQLRGAGPNGPSVDRVALVSSGAGIVLAAMREKLLEFGIEQVPPGDEAEAVVTVANERFDRNVLSVDPNTGRVTEVLLTLEVTTSIRDAAGELVSPEERLVFRRDYVFDEAAFLGAVEQEALQQRDLAEDAALTILLRLEAVKSD